METKKIIRNRPTGLTYKSKNKDLTDEQRKELRKQQNLKYYLEKKENLKNYKILLKN